MSANTARPATPADVGVLVAAWTRRRGVGRKLLADLAALALARDCRRLDLSVLDWNPARGCYERLGIRPNAGWLPYPLRGEALAALAHLAQA